MTFLTIMQKKSLFSVKLFCRMRKIEYLCMLKTVFYRKTSHYLIL